MKKSILVALSIFALVSCKNNTEETVTTTETEIEHTAPQDAASDKLALNNNEKWVVNDEMKPFVMNGEALVNTYIKENKTDYKQLAADLKAENTKLIKSCTMEGASHDELHKWLHPHLEIVNRMAEIDNDEKAKVLVAELEASYQNYHNYFN